MIDYEKPFFSAQNIFCQIHVGNGEQKEVSARLADTSKWSFEVTKYAYILHDKDTEENGEPSIPHFHLLFMSTTKTSKKKWLDLLASTFPMVKREAITLTSMQVERGSLRYLAHRTEDSKDKFQYPLEEVHSFPPTWFENAMKDKRNADPSWEEIASCENNEQLYNMVGLKDYHRAKEAWQDTQNGRRKDEELDFWKGEVDGLIMERNDLVRRLKALKSKFSALPDEIIHVPALSDYMKELHCLINELENK